MCKPQITEAKQWAGINDGAVMLSCCYLGKFTHEEMETGITRRRTLTGKAAAALAKMKSWVRFPGK